MVVLLGILGAWGATMFSSNWETARRVAAGNACADQLRYALDRLSREIREVRYMGHAAGYAITTPIAPAQSTLAFTRTIGGANVTVTIARSGSALNLGYSTGATSAIATQVTAFAIDFFAVDAATGAVSPATGPTNVRYVVLTLTAACPGGADAPLAGVLTERTRVTFRNS